MALAPIVTYVIRDNDSDPSTHLQYYASGLTLAQYLGAARAYAAVTDDIVAGVFDQKAVLSIPVNISTLTGNVADPNSDVEQISAFQFRNADSDTTELNIPCLNPLDVALGSDELNQADATVAAVIAMMEDGLSVTGGTIIPCNVAEVDIVSTNYARKETRSSGRRR